MRVIGIDPGTFRMGVGVVDSDGGDLRFEHCEVLTAAKGDPLHQRLHEIFVHLSEAMDRWRPFEVAIEQPFAARNIRAALAIGQAQAVAMVAAAARGLPVSTYAPRQVKQAVTDHGGSSKEQVQEMVKILLGLDNVPESSDAADALAVAICHINSAEVALSAAIR